VPSRTGDDEITLFKSVGTALEDLVAAEMVFDAHSAGLAP
jgi:ornithine cyclodeaminase/alanine dehydrogenase-like protein (mu-crystallin family)